MTESEEYTYLHDNLLTASFDDCIGNGEGAYTIYLCVYSLQNPHPVKMEKDEFYDSVYSLSFPFLQFLSVQRENQYSFPTLEHQCNSSEESEDDRVFSNCAIQLFEILCLSCSGNGTDCLHKSIFKGFAHILGEDREMEIRNAGK